MRVILLFQLCLCFVATNLSATVIEYGLTPLGPHSYHYDYFVSTVSFSADQELDIRFDPTIFGSISNATAGPGFFLVPCCQPNNPPGTAGDYAIIALSNILSPTGSFGVDVTVLGSAVPGPQPFFINQLDAQFNILFRVSAGVTVADPPPAPTTVPEPASYLLIALAMLVGCTTWSTHQFIAGRKRRK